MIFGYNGPSHLHLPISARASLRKACFHPDCPPVTACGLTPPCHPEPHSPLHKPGSELRAQHRACRADVGSVALAGWVTFSHQLLESKITHLEKMLRPTGEGGGGGVRGWKERGWWSQGHLCQENCWSTRNRF